QMSLPRIRYPEDAKVRQFYDELEARIDALPGVRATGIAISLPPNLLQATDNFMVEGQVLPPNHGAPVGPVVFVNSAFFSTLGVPILRGRAFEESDKEGAPEVVIVNDALAKKYFAGVDPIGRHLKVGGPERPIGPNNRWMTVVGVVGDVKYSGLDAAPEPTYSIPFHQNTWRGQWVVVRAAGDPRTLSSAIRGVVATLDKDIPTTRMRTMDELMTESVAPPRF